MPADPEHIAISKSRGIAIDWKDGLHADYPLALLRDECPCATCTGAHGTPPQRSNYQETASTPANPFPMFKPALRINSVEPIGNYAIRFFFNDTATTEIYTWEFLHELAGKLSKG